MSNSHIRIPNEFFRNPEYITFHKRVKSTVYAFLQAHITCYYQLVLLESAEKNRDKLIEIMQSRAGLLI